MASQLLLVHFEIALLEVGLKSILFLLFQIHSP